MLSPVLRSERAVQVNIAIMRAFVKLREIISTHKELAQNILIFPNNLPFHHFIFNGMAGNIVQNTSV